MNATEQALEAAKGRLLKYLRLRKGDADELMKKKGADMAIQLYRFAADMAPDRGTIAAKVQSLGWRVKRKKGAWKKRPGETAQQVLMRMQQAVIAQRAAKRYYVASGYLPAVNVLRGTGAGRRRTLRPVKNPRGKVELRGFAGRNPTIIISNETPGITYVAEKGDIVRKAAEALSADLQIYIDRKTKEAKAKAGYG